MSTKGRLKADQLSIARFTIDRMKSPTDVTILAALTHSKTGATHGWVDGIGLQWSAATKSALDRFLACLEVDLALRHFEEPGTMPTEEPADDAKGLRLPEGGLAEHLAGDDTPPA